MEMVPFAPKVDYGVGNGPTSIFSVDLDGDGDNDLAVANWNNGNVSVLLNNGNGTFAPKVDYVGNGPYSVFGMDLDKDGDNDLAVADRADGNVSVLLNNGNGTFAPKVDYVVGSQPYSVFSVDLDRDGDNDLVVANFGSGTVSTLLNNGDGQFSPKVEYNAGDGPISVFSADLDGDGDNDLAVANWFSNNVSVLLNRSVVPVVTSIDPTSGTESGGTAVTITGSNFQSGATVDFDGSIADSVVVVSDSIITAVTPAHPAGTVSTIVTNPDGQADTLKYGFGFGELSINTKIAFWSLRDGNREIYVMNVDGTNQVNLTNNPAEDNYPAWSPDGTKIAFESFRDGNGEIYVMDSDGTNPVNLTNHPADDGRSSWYPGPSWSPDGTRIAFVSTRDGNDEIYVMGADGTNQTRLTNNPAHDQEPSWSPDGTKIAFHSVRDVNTEIYVMNADGTNQVNLTNNPANDYVPSWSPDGTKIAFHSNRDGNWEIHVMNADGSNPVNLTNNTAQDERPRWSPFLSAVLPVETVSVSLPNTFVFIGGTLSVPVVITEDVTGLGIISTQMNISYDSDVVKATDVTLAGTLTQGWEIEDTVATGIGTSIDTVKIAIATPGPDTLSGSGGLVFIKFAVSDSAVIGDSTALAFEEFFLNEGDPVAITQNGSVRIIRGLLGDVSGNGRVMAFDAALVLQSTVGLFVISDTMAADVSGDGTISPFDASLILRFVVGIITQFPAETGGPSKVVLGERIISLGDIEALSDERFAVPVLIDEMDGVVSGQLELSFDPTKLKALDATTSDLTSDYLYAYNAQDGRLRLSFAGIESVEGSGRIAEIIFESVDSGIETIGEIDLISAKLNEGLFSVVISQFEGISDVPDSYSLYQNYPNPFNPQTVIHYDLPVGSQVQLSVFNLMGQKVATLVDGYRSVGSYSVVWDGKDDKGKNVASGVYLYRMETDGFVRTRKLILMR